MEGGLLMLELGDKVIVFEPRHPFYRFTGEVIGRRGVKPPDDTWMLILINNRRRTYLIPESMLKLEKDYRAQEQAKED